MIKKKPDVQKSASKLASLGASRGGEARAAVLTSEERRAIARKAVLARWQKQKGAAYQPPPEQPSVIVIPSSEILRYPSGSPVARAVFSGKLKIGDLTLHCHVLHDGQRVFEYAPSGGSPARRGRSQALLADFLSNMPSAVPGTVPQQVEFRVPGQASLVSGQDAARLIDAAEAYLAARQRGGKNLSPDALVQLAENLVRVCAREGILALFDQATGYREYRARRTLRVKLLAFMTRDLQGWSRAFPEDFWAELSRIEGIRHRKNVRPLRWGKYVLFFLHDAVGQELEGKPRLLDPHLPLKPDHFLWLNEFSQDGLKIYLQQVVTGMRACTNLDQFNSRFEHVFASVAAQTALDEMPHTWI